MTLRRNGGVARMSIASPPALGLIISIAWPSLEKDCENSHPSKLPCHLWHCYWPWAAEGSVISVVFLHYYQSLLSHLQMLCLIYFTNFKKYSLFQPCTDKQAISICMCILQRCKHVIHKRVEFISVDTKIYYVNSHHDTCDIPFDKDWITDM